MNLINDTYKSDSYALTPIPVDYRERAEQFEKENYLLREEKYKLKDQNDILIKIIAQYQRYLHFTTSPMHY